jgi:Deltex C-terminal domain
MDPIPSTNVTAYIPLTPEGILLVNRLNIAFERGLTATVQAPGPGQTAQVMFTIPHKTTLGGGKSEDAYPDSTYIERCHWFFDKGTYRHDREDSIR